jgi:hypothetical protein
MPSTEPLRNTFSRPVNSGWKPVPTSSSDPTRPWIAACPRVGFGKARQDLEQGDFSCPVAADDPDDLSMLDIK